MKAFIFVFQLIKDSMSKNTYLACFPWDYKYFPQDLNSSSVLACSPLENAEVVTWPPKRGKKWIDALCRYRKSQWCVRTHLRLTKSGKLHAGELVLNNVVDFAVCEWYLYVLTSEEISRYELPRPSYLDRVILDFQAPAKLVGLEVTTYNDYHILHVTW